MIIAALAATVVVLVAPVAAVPEPRTLCTVGDERLAELSGLAADAAGVWAIPDGGRRTEVFRIDPRDCAIVQTRTAAIDPRDIEDLAIGPDGALWVSDIGDNDRRRETVAVIVLPARGEPRLHRLVYPDGPHDAEALLVDATGSAVIVTKDAAQPAGIYRTDGAPAGKGPTPLVRAGELTLPPSDTVGGPLGGLGSRVVTGAARSADGGVVAVRSYTDAWLYPVRDGDVAGALARPVAEPVRVPLPGEPQGEAVAFLPDGTLLSGSETRGGVAGELRAVRGAAALAVADEGSDTVPPAAPAGAVADEPPQWLPAALAVVAVAAVLLLVLTGFALRRR